MTDGAVQTAQAPKRFSLEPAAIDYLLAAGTLAMLAAVCAALVRGRSEFDLVPFPMWLHLATIGIALVLTPVMLLRARGDLWHRRLGYVWLGAMVLTAITSFFIRTIIPGSFSPIHLLSIFVLYISWKIMRTARAHDAVNHRRNVRGVVIGALLIAGFFTFPFGRLLGHWLLG